MKFSYSVVWDDTARMLRGSRALLLAVAGVFFFLPAVVLGYVAPVPANATTLDQLTAYFSDNMWWILLVWTLSFVGSLVMFILVLDERRPTVGGAIAAAFATVGFYFTVSLLAYLLVLVGLFFFIVPGLYLAARFSAVGPVIVAEPRRGIVATLKRSLEVTKGHGWQVLGLLVIVYLLLYVAQLAVTFVFGSVLLLIDKAGEDGPGIGAFLLELLTAAVGAVFSTIVAVLIAAIYRNLVAGKSVERVFD